MRTEFLCVSVLRVASGPRVKLASCKSALNPPVVYSTDRSKAVVPVLVLLFVALWFILRGDLLYVFPCVILFLCFSVLLVLRIPRLGKRELILVLFVRLFDLCLFGFVGFLFLLGSGKGCGLWMWHSLDFSLTFLACCTIIAADKYLTMYCRDCISDNISTADFERVQNVQIYIILHMRKVSSGHLSSIWTFHSIHWFCLRTANALIRLRWCAVWSEHSLSAYAQRHVLAWRGPFINKTVLNE